MRINLTNSQKGSLEQMADTVKRESRQPRLTEEYANNFYASTWNWIKRIDDFKQEPPYREDSRERDKWLREFVMQEPHLASVLSTAISLDVNRSFSLIGGRNQVIKYSRRLSGVENGEGWRMLKQLSTRDYYSTDIGAITEIERDGESGPLSSLYHVDSAKCKLSGDVENPIVYYPSKGQPMSWNKNWYYRLSSMPNTSESFNRLGFCAISRCVKLAQIMIAVVNYDLEKLGHLSPRGLLFIESDGLTAEMWEEATKQREQTIRLNTGNNYFDNLMVLIDRNISGELLALSGLPDAFDPFKFTEFMMRGYALAFNRDVRAFWSVNSGNFGGGAEAGIQYERATQGGIIDYTSADQEQMERLLPASLLFTYDKDDTRGKLLRAELSKKWTEVGIDLINMGLTGEQVVSLLVNEGVIDSDWTDMEEDTTYNSDGNKLRLRESTIALKREKALENEQVQRAVYRYRDEPIIEWSWPNNKINVLWSRGSDAIKRSWMVDNLPWLNQGSQQFRARKTNVIDGVDVNTRSLFTLAEQGLTREMDRNDFVQRMRIVGVSMIIQSYLHHSDSKNSEESQLYRRALSVLNGGYIHKQDILEAERILIDGSKSLLSDSSYKALSSPEVRKVIHDIADSWLPSNIYNGRYDDAPSFTIEKKLSEWVYKSGYASELGKIYEVDATYRWKQNGVEPCEICNTHAGITLKSSEWRDRVIPKSPELECNQCQCTLEPI